MPLIDLFVTACEWLPRVGVPPAGLWIFLALSFVNGCVLEIGRKIYAPGNEREGVDTYSKIWGVRVALVAFVGCIVASALLLTLLFAHLGTMLAAPVLGASPVAAVALCFALAAARNFNRCRDSRSQKHLDLVAGLWVAVCYATAGFAPLLVMALA
jgi:4-hydroxybenzoate polyprenyltransferase